MLLVTFAISSFSGPLFAQQPAAPVTAGPHQVGLIDMAYVFKNYEKFHFLSNSLQQEIGQIDAEAKSRIESIRKIEQQLTGSSAPGSSSEVGNLEAELLKARTEMETFKLVSQREFIKKEAELYKAIYLEVDTAVQQYAAYYKYTLVLRFNRAVLSDDTADPQEITNGLNRQVIYFRPQDDLTDPILSYLNSNWQKQQNSQESPNVVPAGNNSPANQRPANQNPAATQPSTGTIR
ncbi:OmpH family outer membrane protein [Planctomicrobium sp. SH527]|uniref:OmpH family outer membrane protein n=1 Tax=Planctomicrobium sp. SH527 TaxID=3448123 RepID=UPI003F5C61A2